MKTGITTELLLAALFIGSQVSAADFALKQADKPAPKEIGDSIRGALQSKAIQLVQGDKPALEMWFRQDVPLKSKPSSSGEALAALGETTLIGAVAVNDMSLRDYKDNEIPKGIYTARFGLQPKDGDHLGTAEFDYFLVLIAAENDKDLNGLDKFKPMVKASGKSTSSGHPLVVSLRPASGEGAAPSLTEPVGEHKAIRVKLPGKPSGGEKSDLVFEVIYQGHGHTQ
jgi:hypothetical protein